MKASKFFTKQQKQQILQAIEKAEEETSGEIRLHIESRCKGNALERAMNVFKKLKMYNTERRNGTIIYLAVDDHKFAIYGDQGINEIAPEHFWEDVKEAMQEHFKKGAFAEGVINGVDMIGQKLKEYFPYRDDDINELPNEISEGE